MKIQNAGKILEKLIHIAWKRGIKISFVPFKNYNGRVVAVRDEVRICIREEMSLEEYVFVLAHELSHYYLHFDMNIMALPAKQQEIYEKQADRAAQMLLDALMEI